MRTERGRPAAPLNQALIVSYSYSGHTHRIAQALQAFTGADWCEIYPWQPYPMAFPELLAQVKRELKTGYRPRLLPLSHAPKPYELIFLGCPNWCGTLPPPVAAYLHQHDLSGKVILPFYSHCGGVPCDMRGDIQELCPKARVWEALSVLNQDEEKLPELFSQWLARAGLSVTHKL